MPDLVAVSSPVSLSHHVALVDQLGEDPMRGTLSDSHRVGDIPHPDAWILGDTQENVGVVGEQVPAGRVS
jgi:hypothetical protein